MAYQNTLKIGAVYRSHDPRIRRRVMRLRDGIVEYVLHQDGRRTVPHAALTEAMFREFTSHEIPAENLGASHEAH